MKITYTENNSGGHWRLTEDHYKALEKGGWTVKWTDGDDDKFKLGRGAWSATIERPTLKIAKAEWEHLTGMDPDEGGCPCCGQPHNFYDF